MKGIIFAGDSFTWGQGLYFYSKLPRLFYPEFNEPGRDNITKSHILFKNSKSFPRLVSNYFNTFEIKKEGNGGSYAESLEFIYDLFKNDFVYDESTQTSNLDKQNLEYEQHICIISDVN